MSAAALTARAASLVSCHECSLVARIPMGSAAGAFCPRCGAALHSRRRDSLRRGWALVAAAAILYVPANVYPIMTVTSLGSSQSDTTTNSRSPGIKTTGACAAARASTPSRKP